MINKDFEVSEKIFNLISDGIIDGYDSFIFEIYIYAGYKMRTLHVTKNGITIDNAARDFNSEILGELVDELRQNAHGRGDKWCGFVMNYEAGKEVKLNFKYTLPDE